MVPSENETAELKPLLDQFTASKERMRRLEAEYRKEQQAAADILKRIDLVVRGAAIEEKRAKKIDADMLKAASRIIAIRHERNDARNIAKTDALLHAELVAQKHGFRAVPPEVEARIDKKIDEVYSRRGVRK